MQICLKCIRIAEIYASEEIGVEGHDGDVRF